MAAPSINVAFTIDGVPFSVERKSIKNMYLRVQPDSGIVRVSAPLRMPPDVIRQFAIENMAWVRKRRTVIPAPSGYCMSWQLVWGKPYQVRFIKSGAVHLELTETELLAHLPVKPDMDVWQTLLNAWRKSLLESEAPPFIEKWRCRLGLGPVEASVRLMKRRWGTCYPARGKIFLNSQLAVKPQACLEYVITHELLHCIWPNHGSDFRQALAHYWPAWRDLDAALDEKRVELAQKGESLAPAGELAGGNEQRV